MRYKSNLFIPGHTLDRLDRGLNSNASALIIDLEDGCPEENKIEAREELISLLKKGNVFTKPLFVRVNDAMNENGRQDIDALSDYEEQIEAIILPKTQSFDFLATLAPMIAFENKLVPLIETPRAVDTVTQIAALKGLSACFLERLIFLQEWAQNLPGNLCYMHVTKSLSLLQCIIYLQSMHLSFISITKKVLKKRQKK